MSMNPDVAKIRGYAEKHFASARKAFREEVRRLYNVPEAVSNPTCCDAITGDLFFNTVMLQELQSFPNPNQSVKDAINYLKGRVDQGQADQSYCC